MTYTVDQAGVELLNEVEGAEFRLVAERCEGDKWELSVGCTYDLDGTPFKEGDTCTYEKAIALRANALKKEASYVWPALNFVPNQYQINFLSILAYNIGGSSAKRSSVVSALNDAYEDPNNVKFDCLMRAGSASGMWTLATSAGPSEREVEKGQAPKTPVTMPDGSLFGWEFYGGRYRWYREESGKKTYCYYRRRMRGLLIRHYKGGVHGMGLDHHAALVEGEGSIYIKSKRRWNEKYIDPSTGKVSPCWQDYVISQTSFKEVYDVAKDYPLSPDSVKQEEPVKAVEVVMPKPREPLKIKEIEIAKKKPIDSVEIPPEEVGISPSAPLKKMRKSKRYKGMKQAENFKKIAEITKTVGATAGTFGAGSVPVLQQMTKPATLFAAALLSGAIICVVLYFIAKKKSEQGIEIYEEGLREASQGLT